MPAVKPVPYEVGALPDIDCDNELKAYINLARRINFLPQELCGILRNQVLSFFQERNIKLFDYREVHMYLITEAWKVWDKDRRMIHVPVWCWRPLRNQDCFRGWNVVSDGCVWKLTIRHNRGEGVTYDERMLPYKLTLFDGQVTRHGFYDPANNACRPYDKLVPMRVLDRVREIEEQAEEQFVGKVQFFVSDFHYSSPYSDPFISIRVGYDGSQDDILIFDVWDEPGFTG